MVRIITDSLSDLTMEYAKEHNIDIMALTVRFGEKEYKAGIDMTNEEFYQELQTNEEMPSSAAVNPYEFEQKFREYIDAGDEVVAIIFSKYMSTTFQSASIAADEVDSDLLYLLDCENGAMGQALLIETAISLRDAGKSGKEIADIIAALIPKTKTYIVVDNMDYLHNGGRISAEAEEVDERQRVHPVIQLLADGVKPVDTVKGKKSTNAWLVNKLLDVPADTNYKLVIGHSNAENLANILKERLVEAGIKNEIFITCIGPVIGTHIGPNCLGIGYIEA